jgi:hypothetical protein
MAFTVTVTQVGGSSPGMAASIVVLTGAATSQPGATVEAQSTTPSLSITPQATGSVIFGAILSVGQAYQPLTNTTFSSDLQGEGLEYGGFNSNVTTTAGTPITVGSGSTGANSIGIALMEVLANGTIRQDASTPAPSHSGTTVLTSNAFSPPLGSLLVAMVSTNGGGSSQGVGVIDSSGLNLTWTEQIVQNAAGTGYAGVWTAQMPTPVTTPPWVLVNTDNGVKTGISGSTTYTLPNGAPTTGQLDVLCIGTESNGLSSIPSGWQLGPSEVVNGDAHWYLLYMIAGAGASSGVNIATSDTSLTYTWSRWDGALSPDIAGQSVQTGGGSSSPALTTSLLAHSGELSIACGGGFNGSQSFTGVSWSSGYTDIGDVQDGNHGSALLMAYNTNAGTGAQSPSVTWTSAGFVDTAMLVQTFISTGGQIQVNSSGFMTFFT